MKSDIESVGDHFFVGLQPAVELRPAGVILFKSNFVHDVPYEQWLASHSLLIDDIRSAARRERLIIAIDHEGGRVCRTPAPITRFGYASQWVHQAAEVGAAMGRELSSLGVNLNFAPVLDINSNPDNPVIGPRSFGRDSDQVASSAVAFMSAMQQERVLACGKHFPGHGDTDTDSHYALPVLQQNLQALRKRELEPFIAAIHAGIPMLMTAHMFLPSVDEIEPVTLSKRFTRELLRDVLEFDGVITTDDIGMKAVSAIFEDPSASVLALSAGTDMLMVCSHWTDTDRCRGFAKAIIEASRAGILPGSILERSQERIHTLLSRSTTNAVRSLPDDAFEKHRASGRLFSEDTVEVT
jgi:beta-N-acetylhexosaminidase